MTAKKTRLDEIQKLRAFALVFCCMGHFPFAVNRLLIHGYTGVTIFFVISGYVCTRSYLKTFEQYSGKLQKPYSSYSLTAAEFWISRFFRVVPVIAAWLLFYFAVGQFINCIGGSYGDIGRWMREFKWWLSGAYNYFYAYSGMPGLFGHMWTMAIEIQFYLALPIFFAVFRTKKSRSIACVVIILLSSTVLRMITPPSVIGLVTHTQMDSIFLGVLICLMSEDWKPEFFSRIPPTARMLISAALLLAIYLLPAWLDSAAAPIVKYPIFTALAGILLYLAQLDDGWIFGKGKISTAFFNKVANVSFSVYILHVLVFSCLYYYVYSTYLLPGFPQLLHPVFVAAQIVFLSIVCYWLGRLSVELIEKPYAEYGKRIIGKFREKVFGN